MKFRPVRELLSEAMAEVTTVTNLDELKAVAIPESLRSYFGDDPRIEVKPQRYDERIGWNSHIVLVNGQPTGYTDGPLEEIVAHSLPENEENAINTSI